MDAVLRNFKLIPCPAGDNCTSTNCQWGHSRDKSEPIAESGGKDESQDEDGPRKRRKVFPESEPGPQSALPEFMPTTVARPVSPPPLKRKVPPQTTLAVGNSPNPFSVSKPAAPTKSKALDETKGPAETKAATKASTAISSRKATEKATPRKPESLNPRHLKSSAPATHDFRFKALKMLHEQLERLNKEIKESAQSEDKSLALSAQGLIWMALDEEEKMATEKPSIYTNVIKNRITALKRSTSEQWKQQRVLELQRKEAREAFLTGAKPPKPPLGPETKISTGLTPSEEVKFLKFLETPVDQLSRFGYVSTVPSHDDVAKARAGEEAAKGWEECDRCGTRFQVFPGRREDGSLTTGGNCVHHPGRVYYTESSYGNAGQQEKRYRCCGRTVGESEGCVKVATHVFKTSAPSRLAALVPFVKTPPNDLAPKDRAVCFDCEMGYTSRGMELIRLTATSWPDGKELLDILVNPVGEVLDLNSRYSGVWPEDFRDSVKSDEPVQWDEISRLTVQKPGVHRMEKRMQMVSSPAAARQMLFSLISPETPLIGHGLENDLNAVRIVHPTLIDTILLFPHKRGLPLRNGLKMLVEHHLKKMIQVDTGTGHDSAEDARAAGELVRLKVEQKWKSMKWSGWRLENGEFYPPIAGFRSASDGPLTEKFIEGK